MQFSILFARISKLGGESTGYELGTQNSFAKILASKTTQLTLCGFAIAALQTFSLYHRLMDVSGSKSLFVGPSSPIRRLCSNRSRLGRLRPIILDSIHAAKHLFSVLQRYYHGFLCQYHRKSSPTFLVLILAMMANNNLVDETFKMFFCKAAIRKVRAKFPS